MIRALLLVSIALPVAACGSKPTVEEKNASVEQVAKDVREASKGSDFVKPGKWQSTVTIEQMSMPGLPPQAAAHMKDMMAGTHTTETCLTPEEAKQPNGKFFSGNDQCRYDHFTMRGGKIDAEMHCTQHGMSQAMQMNGTYSPEAYQMHMKSTSEGGPSGASVNMEMTVKARRVGECTGNQG